MACSYCCSLSLLPEDQLERILALLAEARMNLITLPTVNMDLQDRQPGRTPGGVAWCPWPNCVWRVCWLPWRATLAAIRSTPMAIMTCWALGADRSASCIWIIPWGMHPAWPSQFRLGSWASRPGPLEPDGGQT